MRDLMVDKGWTLNRSLHEITTVRSDMMSLLQPRPRAASRPLTGDAQTALPRNKGKGKAKGKTKSPNSVSAPKWVSEITLFACVSSLASAPIRAADSNMSALTPSMTVRLVGVSSQRRTTHTHHIDQLQIDWRICLSHGISISVLGPKLHQMAFCHLFRRSHLQGMMKRLRRYLQLILTLYHQVHHLFHHHPHRQLNIFFNRLSVFQAGSLHIFSAAMTVPYHQRYWARVARFFEWIS